MGSALTQFETVISHVYNEPRAEAESKWTLNGGPLFFGTEGPGAIDFDWWEPRYDQPWRRKVAYDREGLGARHVIGPKPPVEGPNNPDRLEREADEAVAGWETAEAERREAEQDAQRHAQRFHELQRRLDVIRG